MKYIVVFVLITLISPFSYSQTMDTPKDTTTITDSLSYALGTLIGANLKAQGFNELHVDDLTKGILHAIVDMVKIDMATAGQICESYLAEKRTMQFGANKEAGQKFLAENVKKPNVNVTKSGLQYEVLKSGSGRKAGAADTVLVHYEGKFIDGTVFESSIKNGQPIKMRTNQVIAGWNEALQLMSEGSKFRLFIPYELAYGEYGSGQEIPPYSTLIFEIELIKVGS